MFRRVAARALRWPALSGAALEEQRTRARVEEWDRLASRPARRLTVDSRNGRLTFDSRDSIIGRALFVDRNWEYDLIARTAMLLRRHGLVDPHRRTLVDAGAHIGSTHIAFLRDGVFERAVAIEPEAQNLELLERNLRQNGLQQRVLLMPGAVGARPQTVLLELSPDNFGDHRVRVTDAAGAYGESDRRTLPVEIARLDDLLDRDDAFGGQTVGLLWLDVQGFEGLVLQGATRLLERGVPVELEFWPYGLARAGTSKDGFLRLLKASFSSVIDLRDPELLLRSVDYVDSLYKTLVGPFADTELLLFKS
jgi:FkbM family methyltransferase